MSEEKVVDTFQTSIFVEGHHFAECGQPLKDLLKIAFDCLAKECIYSFQDKGLYKFTLSVSKLK